MSWIGGSLSNLTGQLSNLTKDILTEGTEETSDHATELRIAQEKITECQSVITAQKNESERLKRIIRELEENAEAAELQINSISTQYRNVLEDKEKEINALKQSQHEVFQHQHLSPHTDYGGPVEHGHANTGYHGSFMSDDLDFGDNISMQHEINRLTQEVQRSRSECQHWKTVASQSNNSGIQGQQNLNETSQDVLELKNQLKTLEQQLHHGKEQHQQEIACMQDVHSQKVSSLRKKFKAEVSEKEDIIQDIQRQLQEGKGFVTDQAITTDGVSVEWKENAESLQNEVEKLKQEKVVHLSQIESLTSQIQQLGTELHTVQASRDKDVMQLQQTLKERETEMEVLKKEYEKQRNLKDCVDVLQEEQGVVAIETDQMLSELGHPEHQKLTAGIMDTMEHENLILKKKVLEQQEQITLLEKALQTVSVERQRSDSESHPTPDQDQTSITSEMSELSQRNKQLDQQVALLQQQISQYECDIDQFEVVKSDWQSEKEALEDVLMGLREQLREKENSLNVLQAQKGLAEAERRGRKAQEESCPPTEKLKEESEKEVSLKDDVAAIQERLDAKDKQISELNVDKEKLESYIVELTHQLQQQRSDTSVAEGHQDDSSVAQVLELQKELEQLRLNKEVLETSLADTKETVVSLMASKDQLDESLCEVSQLQSQLQEKEGLLTEAQADKAELETGLEELDAQHQEAMDQLIKIRDDLVQQLEQTRNQFNEAEEEIKELKKKLDEYKNMTEDKEKLIQNLQHQLDGNESCSGAEEKVSFEEVQNLKQAKEDLVGLVKEVRSQLQEKEDREEKLEEEIEDAQWKIQEKEDQILNLQQQLTSLREWEATDEQTDISDTDFSDLKDRNCTLEDDVKRLKQSLLDLQQSCDKKDLEIKETKQKLHSGAIAVNDLHMDIKDLEDSLRRSEKNISDKEGKMKELRASNTELQSNINNLEERLEKLQCSYESLQQQTEGNSVADSLRKSLSEATEEIIQLKSDIKLYTKSIEEHNTEKEILQQRLPELETNLLESSKQNTELSLQLDSAKKQFETEQTAFKKQSEERISQLQVKVEALKSEKGSLEKDFELSQQNLQGQIKHLEVYVSELKKKRELDSTNIEAEHQRLLEACHEKEITATKLQGEVERLKSEGEDFKEIMESALESQKQLSDLMKEKEEEILTLRHENAQFQEEQEASISKLKEQKVLLESKNNLEENLHALREENRELKKELVNLKNENANSGMVDSTTLGVITDLESELNVAKKKIAELESEIEEYQNQSKVASFVEHESAITREQVSQLEEELSKYRQEISSKESIIQGLQDTCDNHVNVLKKKEAEAVEQGRVIALLQQSSKDSELEITKLSRHLKEVTSQASGGQEYPDKSETEVNEDMIVKSSMSPVMMQNGGDVDEEWLGQESHIVEEMEKLQQLIQEKDKVIKELQANNASLLHMMETKTSKGDHSLLDVHRLENEVRSLKMEREQMLAVMNEKSRECSNLKSEVHRLMNVISAEKVALDKLQTDNQELKQKKDSPLEDMHKEALQNLSRLVRDKDLEVEALTQKNQTLLQVLQESSSGALEVSNLMQDKDNLGKQLAALQAEREQMVTYLNQKHQESLAYHNEIQRLTAYINSESEKFTQVQQDFDKLRPQFEDKTQALLKVQNELINYKQKFTELEVKHGELLQKSNASETVDLSSYNSRIEEIRGLQEKQKEMVEGIREKDNKILMLRQRNVELEESITTKEAEIGVLHKQVDSLTFQLQGLQSELDDVNNEKSASQQHSSQLTTQLQLIKEANGQLTLSLQQKDFELRSLEEKSQTLTAIVHDQQKGANQQEQIDRLIKENEVTLGKARQLQAERDQAMMMVSQHQQGAADLQREMNALREKEAKALRELERLRGHLLQVEEGYTREALEAEEREKDLRNRLARAEESLISSSSAVENASQQASLQVDSLQQQLMSAATQRDQAYLQISTLQDQSQQYSVSLANLQMVLEQFQQEKEALVATEVEHYQRENGALKTNIEQLQADLEKTKESLTEAEDGLEAAARLMEQLDRKEEALVALKEEVQLRETALKAAEEKIQELQAVRESKVEKVVIKNLFLGYFTTPKGQQHEVLKAIGGVLGFTPTDYNKIAIVNQSWMPGFLRFGGGSNTPSPVQTPGHTPRRLQQSSSGANRSFSELFVKFLEKESSPPPPTVRLPAEEMVLDVQRQKDKPTYNPFTAPRHVAMPGQAGTSPATNDSHILMSSAPMSPTLAVFTPVTARTPTTNTSSAILKDVLASS